MAECGQCRDCKWWALVSPAQKREWWTVDPPPRKRGKCAFFSSGDDGHPPPSRGRKANIQAAAYIVRWLTDDDYGCVQWKDKDG